jgi:hypothetical protein
LRTFVRRAQKVTVPEMDAGQPGPSGSCQGLLGVLAGCDGKIVQEELRVKRQEAAADILADRAVSDLPGRDEAFPDKEVTADA